MDFKIVTKMLLGGFAKEYADIEGLLDHYRNSLDWNLIEEYFSIFDQERIFSELKKRFYNAK